LELKNRISFVLVALFSCACTTPPKKPPEVTAHEQPSGRLEIRVLDGSLSKSNTNADALVVVMNGTESDVVFVEPIVGLDAKVVLVSDELEAPSTGDFVQVEIDASGWQRVPAHQAVEFDFALKDAYRWRALPDGKYPCWLDYDDKIANRQANKRELGVRSTAGKLKSPVFLVVTKDRKFDHIEELPK